MVVDHKQTQKHVISNISNHFMTASKIFDAFEELYVPIYGDSDKQMFYLEYIKFHALK